MMNRLLWSMVTCCGVMLLVLTDDVGGKKSFGCECGKAKQGKTDYRKKRQSSFDTPFDNYRKKRAIHGPSNAIINAGINMGLNNNDTTSTSYDLEGQKLKCHVSLSNEEGEEAITKPKQHK